MTKELFVSSTPHETRVGLVEDDQLAEIYLERENEYTLAGSIYKGRVTRVLPGMQSAFVDIGLERDAFLYVSDFMELEDADEVEEVPTNRPSQEPRHQPRTEPQPGPVEAVAEGGPSDPGEASRGSQSVPAPRESSDEPNEGRGGWRGRRRRRGRRGERSIPESKYARPSSESRNERSDFGPPPGYQPIVLPGESISKYQRLAQSAPQPSLHSAVPEESAPAIAETFPEDEPIFTAPHSGADRPAVFAEPQPESQSAPEWKTAPRPVAAALESSSDDESSELQEDRVAAMRAVSDSDPLSAAPAGALEEEEIEEEEAELDSYMQEIEEDAAFDEMEEETTAASDYQPGTQEIAASTEPSGETSVPFSSEPVSEESTEVAETEEVDDEAEEEAELEEAQAEAEALLDAEARGNGTVDARVEVRGPSTAAAYVQPARRAGHERRGGQRGRRGGGRRFRRRENQHVPQISDLLKEGQEILVQIAKEPIGKKGARITSHIALPGRFLVYMPTVNHTGVSRKIASEEERHRLKRIILSERGENGHGGFIVRTAAQNASEEDLRADIRFLKGLWNEIKNRAESGKAPALIYHDLNVVERVLRDQVTSDFSVIWVDTEQEYERILRFANRFQPALVKRVKLYTKETPLYDQFGLNEEINKALKSKVWLKSGGYIVINQTEALVAIDVNTGKYVGKTARLEDTIVKTNVDAIKEIVRQVRLRDLGGIIVIDFIDMDERRNRQKVMQALEEALRADRAPSKVLQFNDFGLVAITRKRVKQSLERTIGAPCPYCTSTGFVKSVTTVANEIYIEMRKIAKHLEHADVMLRVNPEVAKALKAGNARLLTEMEELTKKTVIVKSDPALHQEQFDIN
ncbi:MAG TPA: Rne/Rng family ribonuclease [Terriglobales bacterium]|jgi:ribonuclease G